MSWTHFLLFSISLKRIAFAHWYFFRKYKHWHCFSYFEKERTSIWTSYFLFLSRQSACIFDYCLGLKLLHVWLFCSSLSPGIGACVCFVYACVVACVCHNSMHLCVCPNKILCPLLNSTETSGWKFYMLIAALCQWSFLFILLTQNSPEVYKLML